MKLNSMKANEEIQWLGTRITRHNTCYRAAHLQRINSTLHHALMSHHGERREFSWIRIPPRH
jgi:hypothetical protein